MTQHEVDDWAIVLLVAVVIMFVIVVAVSIWAVFCRRPDSEDRTPSADTLWYWSPQGKVHSLSITSLGGGRAHRKPEVLAVDIHRAMTEKHDVNASQYSVAYFDRSIRNFVEVDLVRLVQDVESCANTAYAPLSVVQLHRDFSAFRQLKGSVAMRAHHFDGGIVRKGGAVVPPAPRMYPPEPNIETTAPVVIVAYRYIYDPLTDGTTAVPVDGAAAGAHRPGDDAAKLLGPDGKAGEPRHEVVQNPQLLAALDRLMNKGMLHHQDTETVVNATTHERLTYRITLISPTEIQIKPTTA